MNSQSKNLMRRTRMPKKKKENSISDYEFLWGCWVTQEEDDGTTSEGWAHFAGSVVPRPKTCPKDYVVAPVLFVYSRNDIMPLTRFWRTVSYVISAKAVKVLVPKPIFQKKRTMKSK